MNAKLTRIHLGLGIDEAGIQFELDNGAGGTVTQRAFITLSAETVSSVWLAAQSALASTLAELPTDMPPGNVTSALMKARNARQEAAQAQEQRRVAEQERQAALSEAEQTRAAIAAAKAQLADLDKQIKAKRKDVAQSSDGAAS